MIKYWKRILDLPAHHPVKQAYLSLLELCNLGQTNWCSHIKSILHDNHFSHAWDAQKIDNNMINAITENLYKSFMEKCMNDINNSEQNPKLRTYKLFKTHFKLEPYLTSIQNTKYINALARFRISSHNLRIETGRYTKPKTAVDDRICLYCASHNVENECHFLLKCTLYNEERIELLDVVRLFFPDCHNLDELNLFVNIMSSNELPIVEALGKYVYNSMCKRYRYDNDTNIVTSEQ